MSNDYVRAGLILLGTYIGVRIVIYIVKQLLPALTKKTEATWDDELVEKTSGPITWIAMLVGVRFAIGQIGFKESYLLTIEGIVTTIMIIVGGILVYHILDSLVTIGLVNVAKKTKVKTNESLIQFFKSILKFLVIVGMFLGILASWGIKIGPLLAGLGVAGIAIAFALQSTLSNIFGGVSLLLDRTVTKGDLINLSDGTSGKVVYVGLRSTHINTFDNELVIVPNGKLAESNVKNVALPEPKTRVVIPFGVAYGSNIEKVKKIILKEVKTVNKFVNDPEPKVRFLEMGASSLNFKAYFYVETFDERLNATDEATTKIYNALNKAGISIPFPQMDVYIKEHKKSSVKRKK